MDKENPVCYDIYVGRFPGRRPPFAVKNHVWVKMRIKRNVFHDGDTVCLTGGTSYQTGGGIYFIWLAA